MREGQGTFSIVTINHPDVLVPTAIQSGKSNFLLSCDGIHVIRGWNAACVIVSRNVENPGHLYITLAPFVLI